MPADTTQIWLAAIAILPVTIAAITSAILAIRGRDHNARMLTLAEDTHTLVNSNMGATLESYSILAGRMAKITGDAEDIAIAKAAEGKYQQHVAQQQLVDNRHP